MDPLDTYRRLRALGERHAVPAATRRHMHLADGPLVVAAYHLSGELGAPLGIMWGTSADSRAAGFVAVAEPRNRQERFEALEVFGDAIEAYLRPLWDRYDERISNVRGVRFVTTAHDAPQVIVPNRATASWLHGVVGRFTRYLRTDGDDPAPASVRRLGQQLTFLGQTSATPGSCVLLAATDMLTTHWVTGQLDGEKENLATLLAWVDPPAGLDAIEAERLAEDRPPAGPLADPNWDADILAGLLSRYGAAGADATERAAIAAQIATEVRAQLAPAWTDTWRAIELVRGLPEAAHVQSRWSEDRRAWAWHTERMDGGDVRFRIRPTPLQAARRLGRAERATDDLAAQMALDDPAVMAAAVARGEAIEGEIIGVDMAFREIVNGRRSPRPRIEIQPSVPFDGAVGTRLRLASNPDVTADLVAVAEVGGEQKLTFSVVKGANQARTAERLPAVGSRAVFSPYGGSTYLPEFLPNTVPWTHIQPELVESDA